MSGRRAKSRTRSTSAVRSQLLYTFHTVRLRKKNAPDTCRMRK
jgi:hypothetical protein